MPNFTFSFFLLEFSKMHCILIFWGRGVEDYIITQSSNSNILNPDQWDINTAFSSIKDMPLSSE